MGDTPPRRRRRGQHPKPSTLPLETTDPIPLPGGRPRAERPPPERLGEYRIVHPLGEGAMGKVYVAEQESLGRRVALKILPDDFAHDAQAVERFGREAKAAAAMQHPNIVQVYGFGQDDGYYYYTMEYVPGSSLRDKVINVEAAPDERAVAKYILQVALALEYAHGQGVIHRDIKADNIIIRAKDDQALVADFGLSRSEQSRTITQVGALMGTPNYMAPEQTLGRKIDHRIDVYALGATLYECLTGELPFFHLELRQLLRMIKHQEPRPLRELRPDVSADLDAICRMAMAKRPEDRYPSADAMAQDLIRYMRGDVAMARRANPWQVALRKVRQHPGVAALAATLALVVVVSVVWIRSVSGGDVSRADDLLDQARGLVTTPLQRYRDEAQRLAEARQQAGLAENGGQQLNRALLAFREAEQALLQSQGDTVGPADQALNLLDEARVVIADDHPLAVEASELARELVSAQWRRAERQANTELAAAYRRELLDLGALESASQQATVTLTSDPPGAAVALRVVDQADGRWVLGEPRELGQTPLEPLTVEPGEYVFELTAPGRVTARVPFLAGGLAEAQRALHVWLPGADRVPSDFVYVPAGEVHVGGDPLANRPLYQTREPEWVAGFFLARHEVTLEAFCEFLASLPERERAVHMQFVGRQLADDGLRPRAGLERFPVSGVRLQTAKAYCLWRTRRDGQTYPGIEYRLPTDVQWEKAARGPAGRVFPWGDRYALGDASPIACLHLGAAHGPALAQAVGTSTGDVSIYGVHDLGGNLSEWVEGQFGGDGRFGVLRGGAWSRGPEIVRAASREPVDSADDADFGRVRHRVGFRLAFTLQP